MAVIKLTDTVVKLARNLPQLVGKQRIGKGHFSIVFEDTPETVLKLTTDTVHYGMLTDFDIKLDGLHFPQVLEDFGEVGSKMVADREIPLFLVRMERLNGLERGTENARLATKMSRACMNAKCSNTRAGIEQLSKAVIESVSGLDWVPNSVRGALDELHNFCTFYPDAVVDFHYHNFMTRPDSGELVLSDPIADSGLLRHSQQYANAY